MMRWERHHTGGYVAQHGNRSLQIALRAGSRLWWWQVFESGKLIAEGCHKSMRKAELHAEQAASDSPMQPEAK